MEPNRYWFLYFGLLFVFLGSRSGQVICWRLFNLVRAVFHITMALIAGVVSSFLWALSKLLLRYVERRIGEREARMAAKTKS